jgi:hypothetical protein
MSGGVSESHTLGSRLGAPGLVRSSSISGSEALFWSDSSDGDGNGGCSATRPIRLLPWLSASPTYCARTSDLPAGARAHRPGVCRTRTCTASEHNTITELYARANLIGDARPVFFSELSRRVAWKPADPSLRIRGRHNDH